MQSKICAVVVTYNRSELLLECLAALQKSNIQVDILVIDNASTDNTKEKLKNHIEQNEIIYVNMEKNLGGAGGFQAGVRIAWKLGYDYIWLMDDDTIVHADSLTYLVDFASKGEFGFLSSIAIWTDGNICKMNNHDVAVDWNLEKNLIVDGNLKIKTATFVSLLLSRSVIREVGLPIGEYFIWGDDTEYTARISTKYPCYLIGKSVVTHKMNNNQGTSDFSAIDDIKRIDRMFYSIRNDCCTYRKSGCKKFIRFLVHCLNMLKSIAVSRGNYKIRKEIVIIKGLIVGVLFNPKIEKVS